MSYSSCLARMSQIDALMRRVDAAWHSGVPVTAALSSVSALRTGSTGSPGRCRFASSQAARTSDELYRQPCRSS